MVENIGFGASFGCFICDLCDSDLKLRKARVLSDALDCHLGNGITKAHAQFIKNALKGENIVLKSKGE